MSRSTFFLSRSRFLKSRFFSRDVDASRFLSRLSRRVKIVEICRDVSRFLRFVEIFEICQDFRDAVEICRDAVEICQEISTLSRPFESENDEKSWQIEKSRRENTKIHALLDQDWDKLSRNAEIFRSRRNSWSRSRFFGLDVDVETKSRLTFWRCRDFLDCETHSLTSSRSRVSIETTSRQIETPKVTNSLKFCNAVITILDHQYQLTNSFKIKFQTNLSSYLLTFSFFEWQKDLSDYWIKKQTLI